MHTLLIVRIFLNHFIFQKAYILDDTPNSTTNVAIHVAHEVNINTRGRNNSMVLEVDSGTVWWRNALTDLKEPVCIVFLHWRQYQWFLPNKLKLPQLKIKTHNNTQFTVNGIAKLAARHDLCATGDVSSHYEYKITVLHLYILSDTLQK